MTDREKYISLLKPEATKYPTMEEIQKIKIPEQIGCTKALQELVDKATPKKPKRGRLFYNCHNGECDKAFIYYCPVCNISSVEDMNFYFNCGQKLDWSDKSA